MENLIRYTPVLASGAVVTVALALLSLALATVLGAAGAAGRLGGGRRRPRRGGAYTTIVRGVPDLVMLLLVYFGGQRLVNLVAGALGLGQVELSAFAAGVLSIGFIYGAYLAETFRGAYLTIPPGQLDAGRALGLHRWAVLWTIAVPQLVRFALPGYANVWQVLVKSTAVVSVIGLRIWSGSPTMPARPCASPSCSSRRCSSSIWRSPGSRRGLRPARAAHRAGGLRCALISSSPTGPCSPRASG